MKKHNLAAAVLGVALSGIAFNAIAQNFGCLLDGYPTRLEGQALTNAIRGRSIDANSPSGENWKEVHCTNGDLQKVGLGVDHPVDPQRKVGTWNVQGITVTYDYGTGGAYTWRLFRNASGGLCWQTNAAFGPVIAKGVVTNVPCR